jgi:signal peptidase II
MQPVPQNRYVIFFSIAVLGCLLDLATKSWVFSWLGLPGGETFWIIPEIFGLQTSLNAGALFGIGQGMVWLFASLSVAAAAGILVWLFYHGAACDWLLTIALGAIMAGILGNLWDRLGMPEIVDHQGEPVFAVRDWILVCYRQFHWPNFNIADSLLVCGAAILAWHMFRQDRAAMKVANQHVAAEGSDR